MRIWTAFGAVVLAALVFAGIAFGAATTTFETVPHPNKASKKKKVQPLTLEINLAFSDVAPQPPPLRRIVLRFNRGGIFNGRLFPKCDFSSLATRGPSACPRGSKVGSGTATASALPVISRISAAITLFNGEPKRGVPTVLIYSVPDISSPITLQGTVERKPPSPCGDGGQCEYTMSIDVPPIPTLPGQPNASVLTVKTKTANVFVKKKRKVRGRRRTVKIPYIGAPRACTGKWVGESIITFESGETVKAIDSNPCRR
jgi:hypothetical protein